MLQRRNPPEVNAGSMADIAFLLLIFFLVTASIETDSGLNRLLPDKRPVKPIEIRQRNLFEISLNAKDELLVEGELVKLESLRNSVFDFLDNGGFEKGHENYCSYCQGDRSSGSSDNPDKAIVSIATNSKTSYSSYVSALNEVVGAYNELRNREAQIHFNSDYEVMVEAYNEEILDADSKTTLKQKIELIRDLFPQKIIEAQINNQIK